MFRLHCLFLNKRGLGEEGKTPQVCVGLFVVADRRVMRPDSAWVCRRGGFLPAQQPAPAWWMAFIRTLWSCTHKPFILITAAALKRSVKTCPAGSLDLISGVRGRTERQREGGRERGGVGGVIYHNAKKQLKEVRIVTGRDYKDR